VSLVSPIRIGGLTNGVEYAVRVRAVNVAGAGAVSAAVGGTPLAAPGAPAGLMVTARAGRRLTLQWQPPTSGVTPTGYVVQGGGESGEVEASLPVASGLPTLTFDAPPGAYYVRVHALAGSAWSPASNEIRIYADVPLRPSPPRNLRRVVNGSSVALSWENTFELGAPTGILLEVVRAGSSSVIPLPVVETYRVNGVPSGHYEVQVRAVNDIGESGFGSAVALDVPGSCGVASQGPPHAPTDFVTATSGRAYHLAWAPPAAGPAVESYEVQVAGSYTTTTPTTARVLSGLAPPGTYTVSVAARNTCGTGPATPPATVVIP
jgi:titin